MIRTENHLRLFKNSSAFFRIEQPPPCADGAVVAARERNPVDLVDFEQANSAMFFADAKAADVAPAHTVGHNNHFSLWQHLVDPTVEERPDIDGDPELLVYFPRE